MTTARTAASAFSALIACMKQSRSAALTAFSAAGRFSVTTAIPSERSTVTGASGMGALPRHDLEVPDPDVEGDRDALAPSAKRIHRMQMPGGEDEEQPRHRLHRHGHAEREAGGLAEGGAAAGIVEQQVSVAVVSRVGLAGGDVVDAGPVIVGVTVNDVVVAVAVDVRPGGDGDLADRALVLLPRHRELHDRVQPCTELRPQPGD